MTEVEIHTDGACRGNPGPGGWGAVLVSGSHTRELWGGEPHTTNNRMELTAVIRALEALKRPSRVRLYTDSQYVQKGISQWIHGWKRSSVPAACACTPTPSTCRRASRSGSGSGSAAAGALPSASR